MTRKPIRTIQTSVRRHFKGIVNTRGNTTQHQSPETPGMPNRASYPTRPFRHRTHQSTIGFPKDPRCSLTTFSCLKRSKAPCKPPVAPTTAPCSVTTSRRSPSQCVPCGCERAHPRPRGAVRSRVFRSDYPSAAINQDVYHPPSSIDEQSQTKATDARDQTCTVNLRSHEGITNESSVILVDVQVHVSMRSSGRSRSEIASDPTLQGKKASILLYTLSTFQNKTVRV